tara:strand:- start:42 stop:578 length:537 start_codon:yes stop_codon:yes gene_type:complete
MKGKEFTRCNKCGCECYWDTNRNGKRYLAQRNEMEYSHGTGTWKSPHYCTATPAEAAEHQAMLKATKDQLLNLQALAIADGEIVVGQTIKVYRGRKIPQGTMGVVFWVADEPDHFGVTKIGFKDESGVKYFCAINNVDFYFDGADELNDQRVAEAKAEAKAYRQAKKASVTAGYGDEI